MATRHQASDRALIDQPLETEAIGDAVRRNALGISMHRSIGPDDAYFKVIRDGWGESLRSAFHALPDPAIP